MESFKYNGKTYKPLRQFEGIENDFFHINSKLSINHENTPKDYTWEGFYEKAKQVGAGEIDIFIHNGRLVVPCEYQIQTLKK